jgi:6-phosphofructokinase 2
MKDVATVTVNPTVDVNTAVDVVVPERKLRCDAPRLEAGGGGVNVSRALKRLGVPSRAHYLAGGAYGELLERLLAEEGIDQAPLRIEGTTRESVIVLERSSGQQYRFGMPGPTVRGEECRDLLAALEAARPAPRYLVASGSLAPGMPEDFFATLADVARRMGARLVLDTSGAPLRRGVEAGVYLIKPNLREFRSLVGEALPRERDLLRAARALVDAGRVEVVLVSVGAGGALLVSGEGALRLPAPTVPIRSKVGAGDSTVAGFVAGLARELDLLDAARLGVAAGAAAVMTDGTELCRREDVERLHQEMRASS